MILLQNCVPDVVKNVNVNPIYTGEMGGKIPAPSLPTRMMIFFFNYSGTTNAAKLKFPDF